MHLNEIINKINNKLSNNNYKDKLIPIVCKKITKIPKSSMIMKLLILIK